MNAGDLIKKYTVTEETFLVELWGIDPETKQPAVDTLTVRQVKGTPELAGLKRQSAKFYAMLMNTPASSLPDPFKPFVPIDEQTAEMAFIVSALVIDPPFTQVEALELAQNAGPLLTRLHGEIMGRQVLAAGMMDKEVIEATKKLSRAIPCTDPISPSDETISANTLTDGTPMIGDTLPIISLSES